MRWDLIIIVLAYFCLVCIGVGLYLMRRYASSIHGYIAAGGAFGWLLVTAESILFPFGTGHTVNVSQGSWFIGSYIAWFGFIAGVFSLIWLLYGMGRWIGAAAKRVGARTSSELMGKAYGPLIRMMHASISAAYLIALCAIEMVGTAVFIMAVTGLPRSESILIAAVLVTIYVIFSGIAQYGILNLINIIVYYVGVALGFVALAAFIAPWGGWSALENAVTEVLGPQTLFGPQLGDVFLSLGIPMLIGTLGWASASHFLQFAFTAKRPEELKKGVPLAIMLNGYGTWLWVLLGFVALLVPAAYFGGYAASISAARQAGDALGALAVTLQALPVYASAFLLINVLVATLSTGGYGIWAGAMSLVYDVLMPLFPKISDKRAINLIRLVFVVGVLLGAYGGNLPSLLVNSFIFAWAMTVPLFIIVTAALKWRRNSRAALWTIISSWLVAILWLIFSPVVNQTLPSWLHPPVGVIYPVTIIGVMVYVALTLVWSKETKPSLLAEIPQIPR